MLQRCIMSDSRVLMWGEPYQESGLVQSLAAKAQDAAGLGDAFAGLRWGKVVYVVALMVLYAAVVEYFGFILSTAALLLVSSITSSGNVELEYKWKGCVCCVCVSERCEG